MKKLIAVVVLSAVAALTALAQSGPNWPICSPMGWAVYMTFFQPDVYGYYWSPQDFADTYGCYPF